MQIKSKLDKLKVKSIKMQILNIILPTTFLIIDLLVANYKELFPLGNIVTRDSGSSIQYYLTIKLWPEYCL